MKSPSCRVCDVGVYRWLYGRSWVFFLCRKDPGGQHSRPPNILKNLCNMHSETILADRTFVFYLKVFFWEGVPLKGAVFWWFGNCFLVTFEEYQPSWKSRGPHGKLFWDYFYLANCELVFHVSFSNHYYWKLRYRWQWVIGFHFILNFSHPSLFLSVLPLPPPSSPMSVP